MDGDQKLFAVFWVALALVIITAIISGVFYNISVAKMMVENGYVETPNPGNSGYHWSKEKPDHGG